MDILDMELDLIKDHLSHLVMILAIIFGVDMSSSTKIDNRKIYILILGKGLTQGLESTLSAGKLYSINFTKKNTKF